MEIKWTPWRGQYIKSNKGKGASIGEPSVSILIWVSLSDSPSPKFVGAFGNLHPVSA